MYYNYDQYLAYRKAKDAVDAFKDVQPKEPSTITFTNPITNEQVSFGHGFDPITDEIFELYDDWIYSCPCRYPIPYMPNFYECVKHDVPSDVYKARVFDIKAKGANIKLLTPSELHYLQTGDWNV